MFLAVSTIPISIIGGTQGFRASFYLISLIFFVTFSASLVLAYFLSRPLEKLTKDIKNISKGELDVKLGSTEISEINNLVESLNRVLASLKLAVHKVGVKKAEIFEDAIEVKKSFEEKQKDFCNSINGWTWETDSNGVYTCVSDRIVDYLGYNADEIKNHELFDFIDSSDSKKVKKAFNSAIKKQTPILNLENWIVNKNGEKINITTNGYPFFDENGKLLGYRGVSIDNSKIKKAELIINDLTKEITDLKVQIKDVLNKKNSDLELKDSLTVDKNEYDEDRLSEKEFDSFFIFDENANLIDCDKTIVKKLGYSKKELLSLNMADFDALETKDDILDKIDKAKKNGVISFKTIHKRKDGSTVFVYEKLKYIKDENKFKCIIREE